MYEGIYLGFQTIARGVTLPEYTPYKLIPVPHNAFVGHREPTVGIEGYEVRRELENTTLESLEVRFVPIDLGKMACHSMLLMCWSLRYWLVIRMISSVAGTKMGRHSKSRGLFNDCRG